MPSWLKITRDIPKGLAFWHSNGIARASQSTWYGGFRETLLPLLFW